MFTAAVYVLVFVLLLFVYVGMKNRDMLQTIHHLARETTKTKDPLASENLLDMGQNLWDKNKASKPTSK